MFVNKVLVIYERVILLRLENANKAKNMNENFNLNHYVQQSKCAITRLEITANPSI